jgi:hypothetical protein
MAPLAGEAALALVVAVVATENNDGVLGQSKLFNSPSTRPMVLSNPLIIR